MSDANEIEIVLQSEKFDVRPIGNEAETKVVPQGEEALQHVVVSGKIYRATVAEMSDHAQAVVDRGLQLIERGIAVTGGDDNALIYEILRDGSALILLRSKGEELD